MHDDDFEEYKEDIDKIQSPHKVQLEIHCKDLVNKDLVGKSDPYCIVYIKGEKERKWVKLGETETIENETNPSFQKVFMINYLFERNQILRIEVFDKDEGYD